MEDFLLKYYSTITHFVEFTPAITGVLLYKYYKNTPVKYFIYFFVYVFFLDLFGMYSYLVIDDGFLSFLSGTPLAANYWYFNLFWSVIAMAFFVFYYFKVIENKLFKSILKFVGFGFVLFSVLYIAVNFDAFFRKSLSIIDSLGTFVLLLCLSLYFLEILRSDKVLNILKSINFYFTTTIFVWWLITTPVYFFDYNGANLDWGFIFLKWKVLLFANTFMYLTFAFALIWCKPKKVIIEDNSIDTKLK